MKRYDVMVNGVRTTLQLSDADAAARGLVTAPPAPKPESATTDDAPVAKKAPVHKARTPRNKQG